MDLFKLQEELIHDWNQGNLVKYYNESNTKFNYAIKITSGNKTAMCMLFKEDFERGKIINKSTVFANELLNFCDDGSGHYAASFGHDDLIMTTVQLQFVKQTLQYKYLKEMIGISDPNMFNPYDYIRPDLNMNYDNIIGKYDIDHINERRLK